MQTALEDLTPRRSAALPTCGRIREIKHGTGDPATAEEVAAIAAARASARKQLAQLAPMFAEIATNLRQRQEALAPVVATIAANAHRLGDDLAARARLATATGTNPTHISHQRGTSRERHQRRGRGSRSSPSSDGSDSEPPLARVPALHEERSA